MTGDYDNVAFTIYPYAKFSYLLQKAKVFENNILRCVIARKKNQKHGANSQQYESVSRYRC